jgi:hypothetical protein
MGWKVTMGIDDSVIGRMNYSVKICRNNTDVVCFYFQQDRSGHHDICRCYDLHPRDAAPLCKGKFYVSKEDAIKIVKKANGKGRT